MQSLVLRIKDFLEMMGMNDTWIEKVTPVIVLAFIILIAWIADYISRTVLSAIILKIVRKTKVEWDDILFSPRTVASMCRIVAPILIYLLLPWALPNSAFLGFLNRVLIIYMIIVFLIFMSNFLTGIYTIYSEKEKLKNRPLKGLLQTLQGITIFIGVIVIIAILINKEPWALLTGLGASAAILMLVFKDSIMGFVSGIQLTANNMLRVGDWIAMPKYGADGTVIEVTLNTVKVRNWDKTITTIPPYALVSDSFQNWRGMEESGGRRIKRSINIDMNSVRFCTPDMLNKFRRINLLKDYVVHTEKVLDEYNEKHHIDNSILVNGRRQTNLGVFRAYLTNYLHSMPLVNKEMTCMVRQLQPTEKGIPIELYFFSSNKSWVPYENMQSDVFDHVLAIIPEFDLRVYQNPSGDDFRHIIIQQ